MERRASLPGGASFLHYKESCMTENEDFVTVPSRWSLSPFLRKFTANGYLLGLLCTCRPQTVFDKLLLAASLENNSSKIRPLDWLHYAKSWRSFSVYPMSAFHKIKNRRSVQSQYIHADKLKIKSFDQLSTSRKGTVEADAAGNTGTARSSSSSTVFSH